MRSMPKSCCYGNNKNKMATSEVESVMSVSQPDDSCLLVKISPDKSLCFVSTSDYLQYLVSHGVCYSDARVESRGPPGSQLQVNKSLPVQNTLHEKKETDAIESSLHHAVLGGKISLVKSLVKQCSPITLDSTDEQGFTPLLHAVLTGTHEIATTLLKAGASPDVSHLSTGATPLSLACLSGHTELAKLLLKHRASLSPDTLGFSPLHCAIWGGSGKTVKTLLSHRPSLLTARDNSGRTHLHLAAAKGDVTMCQLLVKKGSQLRETDNSGRTALHWAILSHQLPCVEYLLASSSGAALCNQPDSHGATPVHYSAMTDQCSLLTALVKKGASASIRDGKGRSPLFWACACGHVDAARQLIQLTSRDIPSSESERQGAAGDGLPPDEGGQCLRVACGVGSLEVTQLLLQTSPTLVKEVDEEGKTALHLASLHGHTHCLDELLKAGASPNTATLTDKRTSLHVASERGHCEVVASLLASGANHNCSTHPHGERPIHLAAQRGHSSIIIELLRRGCSPDVERHNDGQTALMLAAEGGHMQCCRLLIERGADPSLTENVVQRCTALDLAMIGEHKEVADFLVSVGAPSGGGKFHQAAVTIQAVWRLHRYKRRQRSRREWSAAVIQRAVRRWRRRRMAGRVRETRERVRQRAATIIQSSWRQYMEGRRRYEATCARLRARLQQEHLAASILLEELQAQSHNISLPPPTSPRAPPRSSHKAPATPGYLLHASAPLPAARISSAALVSPTHPRKSLSVPVMRPRKSLTLPPRPKLPPPLSPSSHTFPPPPHPVRENMRDGEKNKVSCIELPSISTQPLVSSADRRPAVQTEPVKRIRRVNGSQKNGIRKSKSEKDSGSLLPVIPSVSSSERERMVAGDVTVEETDQGMSNGRVAEELPPLPLTPSLVSLPPPPPPPASPPSHISPQPPPHQTSPPTDSVGQNEPSPDEGERPTTPSPPQETTVAEKDNEPKREKLTQLEPVREEAARVEVQFASAIEKDDVNESVREEKGDGVLGNPDGTQHGTASRHYLRQTMFRSAILGQQNQRRGVGGERGGQPVESELDNRLLGPIQRYDRLNRVLALLQRVQGAEPKEEEEEEEGVKLTDLRQHIQSALDEAVRLRADTESLQQATQMKLAQKPNSVH